MGPSSTEPLPFSSPSPAGAAIAMDWRQHAPPLGQPIPVDPRATPMDLAQIGRLTGVILLLIAVVTVLVGFGVQS